MFLRTISSLTCTALLAAATLAQGNKPVASPPETATVSLSGKTVTIKYGAPSLRGRKMIGGENPYGKVWRTGANEATSLVTAADLKIGTLSVPAGSYTLYTLPNADKWLLIVNKQTGQWGTTYQESMDLGRIPMQSKTLSSPQEKMSISFENTHGKSTELHIKWDTDDKYVTVTAQ